MRVKLKRQWGAFPIGFVVDVPDKDGPGMIRNGIAEAVEAPAEKSLEVGEVQNKRLNPKGLKAKAIA